MVADSWRGRVRARRELARDRGVWELPEEGGGTLWDALRRADAGPTGLRVAEQRLRDEVAEQLAKGEGAIVRAAKRRGAALAQLADAVRQAHALDAAGEQAVRAAAAQVRGVRICVARMMTIAEAKEAGSFAHWRESESVGRTGGATWWLTVSSTGRWNAAFGGEAVEKCREAQRTTKGSLLCPMSGCTGVEGVSEAQLVTHFHGHLKARVATKEALEEFLRRTRRVSCGVCHAWTLSEKKATHSGCVGTRGRARQEARGGEARDVAEAARKTGESVRAGQVATVEMPTLEEVLAKEVPTMQTVPGPCRAAHSWRYGELCGALAAAVRGARWEAPWDREMRHRAAWKAYEEAASTRLRAVSKEGARVCEEWGLTAFPDANGGFRVRDAWRWSAERARRWKEVVARETPSLPATREAFEAITTTADARLQLLGELQTREGEVPESEREEQAALAARDRVLYTACVLRMPRRGRGGRGRSRWQDTSVQERMTLWREGRWRELWHDAVKVAESVKVKKGRGGAKGRGQSNAERAKKRARMHDVRGAMTALHSTPTVQGPEAAEKVKAKLPSLAESTGRRQPMQAPVTQVEAMQAGRAAIDEVDVRGMVERVMAKAKGKRGRAAGRGGDRYEHYTCAWALKTDEEWQREAMARGVTALVGVMIRGELPTRVAEALHGGRARCFRKPQGSGVRPVVVTEVIARIAENVLITAVRDKWPEQWEALVGKYQMSAGRAGGDTAMVGASQEWFERAKAENRASGATDVPRGLLQRDGENAFGEPGRQQAWDVVARKCPALYPYGAGAYTRPNAVWLEGACMWMERGFLQGATLSPVLHAAVEEELWQGLGVPRDWGKGVLATAFADDQVMGGRCDNLVRTYERSEEEGPKVGILMGADKLVLTLPGLTREDPRAGKWVQWVEDKGGHVQFDGLTVLGCPVGERSYAEKWAEKRVARLKEEYEALQSLEHPQLELWLMRAVMPYKVMNVLRNCPMDLSGTIAEQHDALLEQALARALGRSGGELPEPARTLRRLPRGMGGLGLPAAKEMALAAYLGGKWLAGDFTAKVAQAAWRPVAEEVGARVREWEKATGQTLPLPIEGGGAVRGKQREMTKGWAQMLQSELGKWTRREGRERERAHVESIAADPVGCTGYVDDLAGWDATHSPGALQKGDARHAFRVAVTRTLGLPLARAGAVCEGCKQGVDEFADHALACKAGKGATRGGWKTRRHNACQTLLLGLAKAAGLEVMREAGELGTRKRPGDIKVFWFEGNSAAAGGTEGGVEARVVSETAFDVTVTCTQRLTNGVYGLESATHGAGYQAGEAEKRKRAGWKKLAVDLPPGVQRRREFVPLVFESSGYVAKVARLHIKAWSGGAGRRRGGGGEGEEGEEGEFNANTRARRNLSSAVHYWNAAATISYLRDTLLVQLPISEMGDERWNA